MKCRQFLGRLTPLFEVSFQASAIELSGNVGGGHPRIHVLGPPGTFRILLKLVPTGVPRKPLFLGIFLDLFNYYLFWGKVRLKALTTHSGLFPDPSFWGRGGGGGTPWGPFWGQILSF